MESLSNNYFKMNLSNNSSPENDKKINLNFPNTNNNYNFYQEDDEYYLNRLFSFSDEEKEDEKVFPFPSPFCDIEEDIKIENSYNLNSSDKDIKMDISNDQENSSDNNNTINNNINNIPNTNNNQINNNNIIISNISESDSIPNFPKTIKPTMTKDKGEEVMEKISNYITNYQEIIINQTAVKSQNHFDLDSNVKLAENTLPGSIISLMKKEGHPLSINYIYERIKDRFLSFRKANGAKYKKDINIVLKSTLNTSGIFYKAGIDTYYFKEKESMDFIIKTIERELKKKISKDKKEMSKSISGKKSLKKKKKDKKNKNKNINNELSFNHQLGYKICKLNTILDNMMEKCRDKKNNYIALNKKFRDEGMEMIKNISEKDKFIGTILCIKFFKGIIEKYIKFKNKKINMEKYLDEKKFHEKILKICEKIEKIEESFNNNGSIGYKNNDEMSPNLKTINLSDNFDSFNKNILYGNKNYKSLYESINK